MKVLSKRRLMRQAGFPRKYTDNDLHTDLQSDHQLTFSLIFTLTFSLTFKVTASLTINWSSVLLLH